MAMKPANFPVGINTVGSQMSNLGEWKENQRVVRYTKCV